MTDRTISAEALNRLRGERDEADRRYNNALTTLDRAIRALPEIPHPPPDGDPIDLETLNRLITNSQTPTDSGDGWRGWATRLIRMIFGPEQHQQDLVNQTLLRHLSQLHDWQRATARSIDTTLTLLGDELEALRTFQSILMSWAQQITPYVDTKVREIADGRYAGLASGLDVLTRTYRVLRESVGVLQSSTMAVKRELQRLGEAAARDPVVLAGPFVLPPIVPHSPLAYAWLRALHGVLAYALFGLILTIEH